MPVCPPHPTRLRPSSRHGSPRRVPPLSVPPRRASLLGAAALLGLSALSACGSEAAPGTSGASPSGVVASAAGRSAAAGLTITDGWVKSSTGAMTGAFGTLTNHTGEPVHVVSATTPAAQRVELHETRKDASGQMVMVESADGFTIPAGGTLELRPGGSHLMFMAVTSPLAHGTSTTVTVRAEDGAAWVFDLAVRDFAGANETYVPSEGH